MSSAGSARAPQRTAQPLARRSRRILPLSIAAAYLLLAVCISGRYGPTVDCAFGDYAYGEATWRALKTGADPVAVYAGGSAVRDGHPEFAGNFRWSQMFPLASTLGAASCELFWARLGWLPPTAAHHFGAIAFTSAMLAALVSFAARRTSTAQAALAAIFLLSAPRFFADAQHNLKDAPSACLYTLCALSFYRAQESGRPWPWMLTGCAAGLGLAQKQNAVLLPVHFALALVAWWMLVPATRRAGGARLFRGTALALLACAVTYAVASPWLWHDLSRLQVHWKEVLSVGGVGWAISLDGPRMLLYATPEPLLALGALGTFAPGLPARLRIFLLAWIATSIGRLLLPGMPNFDGVRHFLEVFPPLAMLAAAGACCLARLVSRWSGRSERATLVIVGALALFPGVAATISTHPYGSTYFNSCTRGLRGAQEAHLPDAGDYWAASYWEASEWLSENVPPGVPIIAGIAPFVLRACAPERLRADLRVLDPHAEWRAPSFVVYVTHEKAYSAFLRELDRSGQRPVHEISVGGQPILRVHHFERAAELEPFAGARVRDRWSEAAARVLHWAEAEPARAQEIQRLYVDLQRHGFEAVLPRFRAFLPEPLRSDAEDALRYGLELAARHRERER